MASPPMSITRSLFTAALACVLAVAQAATAKPQADPAAALAALAQRYYDDQARLDPVYGLVVAPRRPSRSAPSPS